MADLTSEVKSNIVTLIVASLLDLLRFCQARLKRAPRYSATLRPAPRATTLGAVLIGVALLGSVPAQAQSESDSGPVKHSHEMQVWVSELHIVPSWTPMAQKADIVEVGGRYGWVLTNPVGPGLLRGELEYAVDFSPLMIPIQSSGVTWGGELNPIVLKWNFRQYRRFHLYAETFQGATRNLAPMPPNGTHINFSAGAAMGIQIARSDRVVWSADVRFHHISDAHIIPEDPTYNGVEVRLSLGFFRIHPAFPFSRAPR